MLQKTDVVGKLVRALGNACQHAHHPGVDLPGIGLSRYRIAGIKSHLGRDHLIGLPAFLMIPVKQLQEAGLGAGGSFRAQKLHGRQHIIKILQIQVQIMEPQGSPLSHCSGLGWLEVGKRQGRLILILIRELGQFRHDIDQLLSHQL